MTDFITYKKPSSIGPGVWYSLHLMSFNLDDEDDIVALFNFIQLLRRKFECPSCRDHFNDFALKSDPKIAMENDIKDLNRGLTPEHLAKWLIEAHNGASRHKFAALSERTGQTFKPTSVSYADVKNFFTRDENESEEITPCENCSDTEEEKEFTNFPVTQHPTVTYRTNSGASIRLSPRANTKAVNSNVKAKTASNTKIASTKTSNVKNTRTSNQRSSSITTNSNYIMRFVPIGSK